LRSGRTDAIGRGRRSGDLLLFFFGRSGFASAFNE
jgi:hypothetical protein